MLNQFSLSRKEEDFFEKLKIKAPVFKPIFYVTKSKFQSSFNNSLIGTPNKYNNSKKKKYSFSKNLNAYFSNELHMEFRTEIKWKNGTQDALNKLEAHLDSFKVPKRTALAQFYPGINTGIDSKIVFAVKCGASSQRSLFIFHSGTKDSSEVSGMCLRNYIGDLKSDWEFLKEKIDESKVSYKLKHMRIELGNEILEKKTFQNYLRKREILAFLVSSTGAPSAATGIMTLGLSWNILFPFLVGLIFWFVASCLGYKWEDEYALK